MSKSLVVSAPMLGSVVSILVSEGSQVSAGETIMVLEVMKVHTNISAPEAATVSKILVAPNDTVEKGAALVQLNHSNTEASATAPKQDKGIVEDGKTRALKEHTERVNKTLDEQRAEARNKRHAKGYRTARENLADLCDIDSFVEYGQLAVAAQRQRKSLEELQSETAADGILTGVASVNSDLFGADDSKAALIINDYSVLAGTQGFYHHKKLDRILAVAKQQQLPMIMYTEGGGGRPGDTDITTVNSGLQCESFGSWAALGGIAPRIAVANGYNFAGNAALFGAADITIATRQSWIGMAGPAMIAGGGLGDFKPTEIGPIDVQAANGVVDIVTEDEAQASDLAKRCLSMFQGDINDWQQPDQDQIADHMPENRRYTYQVRDIIQTLADQDSFIELKSKFGGAVITGFIRLEGKPVGLMANDCNVLGGAIDVDAGEKAADFLNLCNQFNLPVVSLCDTPGFMVGPQHEERGAVRRLAKLFTAGSHLSVPLVAIVLRKCYGLGAQAMVGGSTSQPIYTAAWPTGEFGPMGLEGAVTLGFKKELEAEADPAARQALFDKLLAEAYARGRATEVASVLEIDAVIQPSKTRAAIIAAFAASSSNSHH
ncbi:MAG: carboxyl transferase domain-containing protein [Pseudomonadota bacterium]